MKQTEQFFRYRFTEPSGEQHTITVYAKTQKEALARAKYKAGLAGIPSFECKVEET